MAQSTIWVLIAILGLLVTFLAVYILKKEKKETDYQQLFKIGIIWVIFGAGYEIFNQLYRGEVFEFNAILILGLIFTISGLANKSKWNKKQ